MPRVTLDLSEARSFDAVEPGVYQMIIDAIEEPKKSKGGTGPLGSMIDFKFADPSLDQKAGTVSRWYAFEGKGSGFFRELWKAATGEDLPVGQAFDIDTDDAIGRTVNVLIDNEEYEGRMQNRVQRVSA